MAKVNSVSLCPHCNTESPLTPEGRCPSCRFLVRSAPNPVFESGYYLTMQKQDAIEKAAQLKSPAERDKEIAAIEQAYRNWALGCSDEDRLAAMEDALHLLRHIVLSPCDPKVIKLITSFGKNIGDLSNAIENYFAKSGATRETAQPSKAIDRPENPEAP